MVCQKSWTGLVKAYVVGFDSAANMSGKVKGLQARISAKIPTAQSIRMYVCHLCIYLICMYVVGLVGELCCQIA